MATSDTPAGGATSGPKGTTLPDRKLDSWGEIASYLGREVRTVQRWERTEGLPVHRHEHKKKSTVYAFAGELDEWIRKRQPKDDPAADDAFAYEQELSGTDSPIDIVEPPAGSPAPVPTADSVKTPAAGKRVIVAIFTLAILSALSLGVYRWLQPTISPVGKVRIAVLPFTYVSGDSKPDYITDGLTDVIRTALSQLDPQHLGVIAATSSKIVAGKPITEIGRVLNVSYVLEGSVQRAGNQVRIDVQLIQVSDETHLWADSFTRELSDVLQVQSDVSAAIARQILATLPLPHNLRHRSAGAPFTPLRQRSPSPATPTIRANLLGETDTICAAALPISRKPSARIHPSPKPTRVSLGRRRFWVRCLTTECPLARPNQKRGRPHSEPCSSIPGSPKLMPSSATWL